MLGKWKKRRGEKQLHAASLSPNPSESAQSVIHHICILTSHSPHGCKQTLICMETRCCRLMYTRCANTGHTATHNHHVVLTGCFSGPSHTSAALYAAVTSLLPSFLPLNADLFSNSSRLSFQFNPSRSFT